MYQITLYLSRVCPLRPSVGTIDEVTRDSVADHSFQWPSKLVDQLERNNMPGANMLTPRG